MRIVFLHISDMHFDKKEDMNYFQIRKIADSLHTVGKIDHIIIVLSGDLAYSGKCYQYKYCWHMLGQLINKLKENYVLKRKPIVLVVPGNHDVDLSKGDLGHIRIKELYKTNKIEGQLISECKKLNAFMNYAYGNNCFDSNKQIFWRKIINLNGFIIEANLLNTALFSTLEEDKGLHYVPRYVIDQLSEPSGADFVITVMHHSQHWFNDQNKTQLEDILYSKNSLLFFGHEHNLNEQDICSNGAPSVEVLAGGELCNRGDWSNSKYFACVFNTEDYSFTLIGYSWDQKERIYQHKIIKSKTLPRKASCEKSLSPSTSYLDSLLQDQKHKIAKNFTDYYVFPRLQLETKNERALNIEIKNETEFLMELEKKKKIIITGNDNSGKTTLLKYLFSFLSKTKIVLFCDIYHLRSGNPNKVIKRTFEDIYGENVSDYIRFQQMPKSEKVLIIDEVDRVNNFNYEELEEFFDYVIYSVKNGIELDVFERVKKAVSHGSHYKITPFFADKREELIHNIVKNTLPEENGNHKKTTYLLAGFIKKQRSLCNLNPDFIIQYTLYYCKNIHEATENDGGIFSKVFEANIVNQVMNHLTNKISVDKLFIVLDKVAYYIHKHKAYPLKQQEVINIISTYNEKYDQEINVAEFIQITLAAKILVLCNNDLEYKFANNNYLAYFVAREINRKYLSENDNSDLIDILKYSCFGINASILLFVTYITDNTNMLRLILKITIELTDNWEEFNLNDINIPYLANIKDHEVTMPTAKQKQNVKEHEIEHEKSRNTGKEIEVIDIYDYEEDDINKLINQVCRALSLLNVISRSLPSFEHMMYKEDKEKFVDIIYRLPNKIFYLWATEVQNNLNDLLDFLKEFQENDYSCNKKYSKEEILRLLQWDSMSLHLDILNMAALYSTKGNTEKYLSSFDYKSRINYSLQHLMVVEQRNKISEFTKEASEIYNISKNSMSKTMVKRVVRHLLIHSRTISHRDIQRLEGKYFSNASDHRRLLLERANAQNKR